MKILVSLLVALAACSPSEPSKPAVAPAPAPSAAPPAAPPAAEAPAAAPSAAPAADSYDAAIAELRQHQGKVSDLFATGNLKGIHPEAEALMNIAVGLPAKASGFSNEAKGTVALRALDLKTKADEMHDHADKGEADGAKAAFDGLSADIEALAGVSR
jgi:hypothetical protein